MSNPYLDALKSNALGADAPSNPYLDALQEQEEARKRMQAAQLSQAVKVNPEQYNTQRRVAQYLGYPVAAVETLPDLADQAKVQQIQQNTASSPVLQRKYGEADFAKLAHDDSDTLANIWKTLKRGGMLGTWWRFATGTQTPQQPEEIEEPGFRAWNGPKATPLSIATGLANAIPEASQAIRQGLRMQMGDALEALGLIKRDPVYLADQQRKLEQSQTSFTRPDIESPTGAAIYSGAESFLRAIPGVAASVATRSPTPALTAIGVQTQAEAYGKYRARGGTPGESFAGATGEAIVELATEYIPGKYLAESLGKVGAKEFILNFIKKDALGEQAATILQDAIDTAIANPDKTWEQYLAERPMAAYQTLVATLTQAGLMSGVNTALRNLAQMGDQTSEAELQADRLQQALQAAGQSLLRERSPDQFRTLMAEMTDGNVYVDGQVLNQLAPEALNQLPESVRSQIATAAAIGDSVEIPVADVLTIAPGTPLEQVFVENARTSPDAPSLAEARAAGEKAQEFLQQEAERVIAQAQDQEALRASQEAVKQNIRQQLAATGRFRDAVNEGYATWAAAFYTAYGSRLGMTPEQFYQRYPLRILGAAPGQQVGVLNAEGGMTLRTVNVGDTVDGRVVRDGVPNLDSIGASLDNYEVLPGVREVPMSAFDAEYVGGISMDRLDERTRKLAEDIRASGEITPLIVVQDAEGMYVLEGGHRFDALIASGAQSLPAVVVIDKDNPPGKAFEQSATLRRGTETLKKYGLKPGGKYKTREVAAALEARQRAKYGTIAADDRSAEALANIAKWMVAEVEFEMGNPEKSGVGWYSERFQRALDEMGSVFPELKTDKTARNVMTALIAITSDGQKVVPNFAMAMDIYGNYRPGGATAGRFTTTRGHARQASINGNLEVIQRLHDTMGADGMHQYLMQEKTISELKKLAKENGGELKSDYQAHIKMPMAAVEFGPKLGAFYANLMGAHGYLTMDRWWSRTFNRYRGTLLQSNTQSALDTFKKLIGKPDISNDEVLAAVVAPREALEARGFKTRLALLVGKSEPSKAKDKAAWMVKARELAGDQFDAMLSEHNIERAANTIYKTAFENLEDAPFNATDRTFMLDAVNKAQQTLKRKGYNLSVADIQAILWYYEKRLYGELGARQTADISYEEAAQRVASSYASGQGIESLLDDAGAAREDGGADEEGVPVGEDDFAEGSDGVLNQGAVLEQQQAEARDLVLTHNLSAENLLHAQRMGGIPVPSLAVTKSDTPVEGFGEITLIGGPEMADPKGYAGTKVFGADIYSPRYPSVEFKLGNAEMKALNAALESFRQEGDRELYGSDIRRPDDLTSYKPFKRWSANRYGIDEASQSWSQLTSSVNALMREVGAKERIFQGFTYSGNRRYIDHTIDNVVKILKKELRGGENFNYGVGSIRAKLTPQFKSVAQIRKEKSRLVDKATFDAIKKEIDTEFVSIAESLGLSLDQTVEVFEDAPKMGAKRAIERALRDYRQDQGEADIDNVRMVGDFLVKLRNLPTQYFEAKILRAVDVAEFKAAVVPADASPEVLAALADRGVTRVATYDPAVQGDRAEKIQQFSDLFFQGATTPRGTFNPQTLELVINPNADLSTWFHETGHFFLEVLADIANQPNAPAQIVEDFNKVLGWFGVTPEQWAGFTLDQKRPYHERWAESIEQYVMEGKAPSVELQGVMRRFAAWLKSVYGSIKQFIASKPEAEQQPLNDDIRRVMDRMLATDEQIAQANEVAGLMPDEQADGEAAERLQKRSMADLKWSIKARDAAIAKLKREAKVIEKQVREEVTAEVDATPEMRAKKALDALQITPEYEGLVRQHAEERAAVERTERDRLVAELYAANPDVTGLKRGQLLAKNRREIANKVDAYMIAWDKSNPKPSRPMNINDADLATVADSFGFESVPAMLEAISAFGSRQDAIDGMTERRMLEEHGDLIDERAITEAANEAVHNEARARSLATELRTQREMLGARTDTGEVNARGARITVNALVEAAKQFGANVISRTPLKDLRSTSWKHTAAERRAGKRWQEATAAGKTEDAVKAKQDQMLNNAAAKAALDAAAESKKILEFFRRVTKGNDEKVVEKGRDPDIVNAARAVLAAYGVETSTTKGAQDYLDVLQRNDPDTYAVVQPMMAIAMQNAQPLEALTFEELQGLHESIQAMWHLAKRSRQMEVDGDLLDIDDVAQELFAKMEEIGIPDTLPGETGALTKGQLLARQWLQAGPALLRRVEQWAEAKDGEFGGPFLRLIFQPVKDAADRYRKDRLEYRQKFQALVDQVAPTMTQGTIAAPELGYTFGQGHNGIGHAELLHAILHTGNDSNKRKLLLGRGWATENPDGTIDTRRWDAFLQRLHDDGVLTKAHWDFAQGVWDLMEETKPLAQKTHRDVFGRYFEEVTANPVSTPFGTYRGGYVPAQADPLLVQEADLRDLLETENAGMSYAFPQTNRGFTKGRVEYNRPLKLDLRTLPQHIDKVLLFSHMEPAVRGVARLIRRPKVNQPLIRIDPAAVSGVLRPWLNRAARQTVETPISADAGMNRMASTIRGRVGMALMFANVSNTLQQITGAFTASIKVPPADMMRAAAQYVANPKKLKESVWALSPYMADRSSNEVAVLSDTLEQILINPSVYQKAEQFTRRHSYFLQTMFDNQMSPIIWTAAYNQGLRDGMEERMAIRYADGVIRQTQGSTLPEDVSRIETGPAYARLFTQFVGYFNMMANTNATALQQIAREQGLKKGAGKAFYTLMIGLMAPIWVAEAIALAFKGGPEDDEGDGWLDDWIASVLGMGTIKGILSGVPFLGAVAQSAVNRFNDQPADDKFSLSPTVSVLESAVGAPASVYKAIVDDASAQKAVRDSAALITVMTGLPAMTVARPVGYLAGVDQGRIQPTSEVDLARGLITGTASPESKAR